MTELFNYTMKVRVTHHFSPGSIWLPSAHDPVVSAPTEIQKKKKKKKTEIKTKIVNGNS